MNNTNTEWFWNTSTNNHVTLTVPVSMQSTPSVSTNAIITDVGICVGMRNVSLNGESACFIKNLPHCCKYSIPRPLIPPNWYNNYTQFLCRDDALTKYHQTPVFLSHGLNALLANEYSSANIRDGLLKFHHNMSSTYSYSQTDDFNFTGDESNPTTSNVPSTIRDQFSNPSFAPPKKKWIRHYMMGE